MALCLVAGTGCEKKNPADRTAAGAQGIGDPRWVLQPYLEKERKLARLTQQGLKWALIAEVRRGNRRAAVFYPALRSGQLVDNDIVGLVFEQEGRGWRRVGSSISMHRRDGKEHLDRALGGTGPVEVLRPCGLPREELPGHVKRWGDAFFERRLAGDDAAAMQAYQQLVRAFAFDLVAHGTSLQTWLAMGTEEPGAWPTVSPVKDDGVTLAVRFRRTDFRARFRLSRCDQGWVVDRLVDGALPR